MIKLKTMAKTTIKTKGTNATGLKPDGVIFPYSLTRNLAKTVMEKVNTKVSKICINGLKNNTFYAKLSVKVVQKLNTADCEFSDAIVFA